MLNNTSRRALSQTTYGHKVRQSKMTGQRELGKLLRLLFSLSVMFNSFATLWTVAHQAPLSVGFSRQEYWSGVPFSSPGDLPDPGIKRAGPVLTDKLFTSEPPGKDHGD